MRGLPGWALKSGTVCLTFLATFGSAGYIGGHVKNQNAPLHPPVVNSPDPSGQLNLGPGVRSGPVGPITSTYAS